MRRDRVLEGYAAAAARLINPYDDLSPDMLYRHVAAYLPTAGARVVDLGAGTGRDAAWLAARGCRVLAVEPVAAFRHAGAVRHPSPRIEWLDDSLPDLDHVSARGEGFDTVLLSGVWHHLDPTLQPRAMDRVAALCASSGWVILSLRHGPGPPDRPCFPVPADAVIAQASASGLKLRMRRASESIQVANRTAGVTWTWLMLAPDST